MEKRYNNKLMKIMSSDSRWNLEKKKYYVTIYRRYIYVTIIVNQIDEHFKEVVYDYIKIKYAKHLNYILYIHTSIKIHFELESDLQCN